jgi:hypothetical protein
LPDGEKGGFERGRHKVRISNSFLFLGVQAIRLVFGAHTIWKIARGVQLFRT